MSKADNANDNLTDRLWSYLNQADAVQSDSDAAVAGEDEPSAAEIAEVSAVMKVRLAEMILSLAGERDLRTLLLAAAGNDVAPERQLDEMMIEIEHRQFQAFEDSSSQVHLIGAIPPEARGLRLQDNAFRLVPAAPDDVIVAGLGITDLERFLMTIPEVAETRPASWIRD